MVEKLLMTFIAVAAILAYSKYGAFFCWSNIVPVYL